MGSIVPTASEKALKIFAPELHFGKLRFHDTIDRSIKKAAGNEEGVEYEVVTYEGYGPCGVAVIVEALVQQFILFQAAYSSQL